MEHIYGTVSFVVHYSVVMLLIPGWRHIVGHWYISCHVFWYIMHHVYFQTLSFSSSLFCC